jgi:hypothetical protein
MILLSVFPALVAVAIFFGTLRQRGPRATTQAEREAVAGSAREFRRLAGMPLVCVLLVLVGPVTVAALHLAFDRDEAFVTELR